jgi:hypothetical protein
LGAIGEEMEEKKLPDFSGKVLIIYTANAPRACQDGTVLEYAQLEKRGGRLFLTGRFPDIKEQEWLSNCQTAIAWDSIVQYVEYKSMKDFQEHMKHSKPSLMQRLGR